MLCVYCMLALLQLIPVISMFPQFAEPIPNITVAVGRDAMLQCTVDDLENYKVAWIKMDTQTLLSIHTHVITRDSRIRVSNNNHRQWYLHIKEVRIEDQGSYMCQINTEPMVSQLGYLEVMVPPSVVEDGTSSDIVVEERSKVSLRCRASGYPVPNISWRREDGKDINLGSYGGRRYSAPKVEGEYLNISQVTREDMGAYLCIAWNGVPPTVSKRILVQVNFRPKIRVPNQLVGAAANTDVTLECKLEASPRPLTSWIRSDGMLLLQNRKYELTEEEESYKITMKIKIFELNDRDFGSYKCLAKNTLGEKEGFIRLYEIPPPTTLPRPTPSYEVYLPRMRDSQNSHNDSYAQRKTYGVPATNSLMDESHDFRAEKDTRISKSDRTEDIESPTRSLQSPTHTNKSCRNSWRDTKWTFILLLLTASKYWFIRIIL
ncbi:lachesin-like isoform X2 [Centruroides vittatus]|uniref:lachesin-like isoform X2 n=1 Tax=Centruroides vittatus TaxID=120091 RepID=UPI00350EACF8